MTIERSKVPTAEVAIAARREKQRWRRSFLSCTTSAMQHRVSK